MRNLTYEGQLEENPRGEDGRQTEDAARDGSLGDDQDAQVAGKVELRARKRREKGETE